MRIVTDSIHSAETLRSNQVELVMGSGSDMDPDNIVHRDTFDFIHFY